MVAVRHTIRFRRSPVLLTYLVLSGCFWLTPLGVLAQQQMQQKVQRVPPMQQQAQQAIKEALRADVVPLEQGKKPGEEVPVRVSLSNAANEPVSATQDVALQLEVVPPSGKVTRTIVHIAPGTSSAQVNIVASEPGLTKLYVRHLGNQLLESTNYVLVSPTKSSKKKRPSPKSTSHLISPTGTGYRTVPRRATARLLLASMSMFQPQEPGPTSDDDAGGLIMKVSGENDAEVRADGKSFARISIYCMAAEPPKSDIQVWLTWSNGAIDKQPILIKKDERVGEAHWTSEAPISAAKVSVAAVFPHYPIEGPNEATVRFVEPILGVAFVNPPAKITIVDRPHLSARFFDLNGNPIQTTTKRKITFSSNSTVVQLDPNRRDVDPGDAEFETVVFPAALGSTELEVATPGYKPGRLVLVVTGTTILFLCIVGGILGGLVSYLISKGSLIVHVLTGVIAAGVASWAYVYVGLPKTPSAILHNEISVLFVSILAGVGGAKVFNKISTALGWAV